MPKIISYGYTWHFVSNGQQTKPYLFVMERYRDSFKHVALSIDGANAGTHDEIRERKGAFKKVTTAVRTYVKAGYRVHISMTLNQKNKNEVAGLLSLTEELSVCRINFGGMIPTPWNKNLVLNDDESQELYQQIIALHEKSSLNIQVHSSLYTSGGISFCNILSLSEPTFNSLGQMIFCCDTIENGAIIGSLYEYSYAELVKRWLVQSSSLQAERTERIKNGDFGEKFDTCAFCNSYFNLELSH